MTDNDMLMAKTERKGWTNLAIGEPAALQESFRNFVDHGAYPEPLQVYPSPGGGSELVEEVKAYMERHVGLSGEVVVANGAKQALLAALYAYRVVCGFELVTHRAPYWPSHPTLAYHVGMHFTTPTVGFPGKSEKDLVLNTSPNNPDGSIDLTPCEILDAAYWHPVYGIEPDQPMPEHQTSIWSAAKLFGMSGDRIGWLMTSRPEIAKAAREFIEATTSGVSIYSQQRLSNTLNDHFAFPAIAKLRYEETRSKILDNGAMLWEALGFGNTCVTDGMRMGMGMFAWLKCDRVYDKALTNARIQVLAGAACGMPGWVRINLGASPATFKAAMRRLVLL
jgi:aspartate/methionine/tyrosine aminotransferase